MTAAACVFALPHFAGSVGLDSPVGNCSAVGGNSQIGGQSQVGGDSQVGGQSQVGGNSPLGDCCPVGGDSQVGGQSQVGGNSQVGGDSSVGGCLTLQTIAFTSYPGLAAVGGLYYPAVTSLGGASGIPITVTVDPLTTSVCQAYSFGGGTSVVRFIGPGTCLLDANQPGDASYAPAPQVQQSIHVYQPMQTQTLYWNSYPQSANVGETWPLIATGGSSGLPVVLAVDPNSSAQCSLQPGGFFGSDSTEDLVTFASVGTCLIDATQAGDAAFYSASPIQVSIVVTQEPQTITFTSYPSGPTADGVAYDVTATGGASGNPVTFSSTTPAVCNVSGDSVSFLAPGSCTIEADQAGTDGYLPATAVQSFFVAPAQAPQTVTITSSPTYPEVGGSYLPTAVGGASGNLVTFTSSTPAVCAASVGEVTFLAAGTCTIDADQAGNTSFLPARTVMQTFTVAPALAITSAAKVTFTTGMVNTFPVTTDSPGPVTIRATGDQDGLTFAPTSGTLSGTPTAAGKFHLVITAANGNVAPVTQHLLLVVLPFHVTTTHLADATRSHPYSAQLIALGGREPLTWQALTPLPNGLSLSARGNVHGRPSKTLTGRNYSFTVKVTDSSHPVPLTATATITVRIQ
jgi:hypothetical protein